jgi:hypothetical protein
LSNTLLTISMITREALRVLENQLTFTKFVKRDFDDSFGKSGAKIGDTLNVRKPPRYLGRTGANISVEDATETSVPVKLTTQRGVDISFTSADFALSIDDFSERFIVPAIASVANAIDYDGLQLYKSVPNLVGTRGTIPNALSTYLNAGVLLTNNAAPRDKRRNAVVGAQMEATLVDSLKGLFQSSEQIASQYENGTMGRTAGLAFSMDQNCPTHTVGPLGGTPLVDGASQTGALNGGLATDGWGASVTARLKKGDVFTIAGVNSVNPQSRVTTGNLQQFVVTADVSSNATGTGQAVLPIYPIMVASGAFQNVTALPADNAAITVVGTTGQVAPEGLAFHRDAFTFASADLPLPGGVDMAARVSDKQLGMSMRLIRQYNISTDAWPCRLDVLYGWKELYPEWAVRIAS